MSAGAPPAPPACRHCSRHGAAGRPGAPQAPRRPEDAVGGRRGRGDAAGAGGAHSVLVSSGSPDGRYEMLGTCRMVCDPCLARGPGATARSLASSSIRIELPASPPSPVPYGAPLPVGQRMTRPLPPPGCPSRLQALRAMTPPARPWHRLGRS